MPEITEVFYPKKRAEWRAWLKRHHAKKSEVWVRRFKKAADQPCISYDELVEECLCFGWIDGIMKKFDDDSNVQRVTRRREKGTFLSELNRQRVWKLQRLGLMTDAGIEPIAGQIGSPDDPFEIPDFVLKELKADPDVWKNFRAFPHFYQRLKVGWIAEVARFPSRHAETRKRLDYLIKNTRVGKMYGTIPEVE
ncbi:MAG: YdeI/OmpD-associated family protein [Rhodothermales bacterium]